jgi:hypothetical protein
MNKIIIYILFFISYYTASNESKIEVLLFYITITLFFIWLEISKNKDDDK